VLNPALRDYNTLPTSLPKLNTTAPSQSLHIPRSSKRLSQLWRLNDVAAFCACCGAEITLNAEACPVCGTPQHEMAAAPFCLFLSIEAMSPFAFNR
jgi:hypothetical protein